MQCFCFLFFESDSCYKEIKCKVNQLIYEGGGKAVLRAKDIGPNWMRPHLFNEQFCTVVLEL